MLGAFGQPHLAVPYARFTRAARTPVSTDPKVGRFTFSRLGHQGVMQILGLIVIGVVIGLLARLVLPGRQRIGVGLTVLLGIAGALVGGIVASAIGTGDIFELNILGTIVGIVAAAGLIGAADRAGIGKTRRRDALKPG
jgi:uncharacterized membrane protein YeaQ/YmgE (transglycosylase-associated protein family)